MHLRCTTLGVLAALFAGACGEPTPLTEILVVVDSDLQVPEALDTVSLEILRPPDVPLGPFTQLVDPSKRFAVPLPVSVGIKASSDPTRRITVVATGVRRTDVVVEQQADVDFQEGRVVVLCIRLDADCQDVVCEDDTTCRGGMCTSPAVGAGELQLYDGEEPTCQPVVSAASVDGGL